MKKWMMILAGLPLLAGVAHAQESRQDFSVSYSGLIPPTVVGNAVHQSSTIGDVGVLGSYRYQLTPRGAAEVNYGYNRYINKYETPTNNIRAHTQYQEFSAEYVFYPKAYGKFFPFIEGGIGGFMFGIINDNKSSYNTGILHSNTNIGIPYGAGVAYEVSPSFDIRVEYRGIVMRSPDMSAQENITRTGRYTNINNPVIGFAYHF